MKRSPIQWMMILAVALIANGCGSGAEPLIGVGDPTVTPQMVFPIATANSYAGVQGWSSSHQSLEWNVTYTATTNSVFAPAGGLVVAADANSITIMHSVRYTSVISKINAVIARINDYVAEGQVIGTLANTGSLQWAFYVDGTNTCPASFLSQTTRQTLISTVGFTQLCQP